MSDSEGEAERSETKDALEEIPEPGPMSPVRLRRPVLYMHTSLDHLGHEELCEIAQSQLSQFQQHRKLADIERAIEYGARSLELTPERHPDLLRRFTTLGASYIGRFQRLGKGDDLATAIEYYLDALVLAPHGHPELSSLYSSVGAAYSERFRLLNRVDDLHEAIMYQANALSFTPDGHPELPRRLADIGTSFIDRFRRLGEMKYLQKALEHHSRALELTPEGHPDLSDRLADLAVSHRDHFRHLGHVEDIEKAIAYESRALELTPDDHPDLSLRLANLGTSYADRFVILGDTNDLSRGIEYETRALELTPSDHPDLPARFANLGSSYSDRFRRLGQAEDLERAISFTSRAHSLTPEGHSDMLGRLANLGNLYRERFEVLGELDDLEKAITYCSRAVRSTFDDNADMPGRLSNLGACYYDRFRRLGKLEDLEESLKVRFRAHELTPHSHPDQSRRRADLGASYAARFHRLGELEDLEKAIEHKSRALAWTPNDHPDLPHRYADLGVSFNDRFRHLGDLVDLEEAIKHKYRALELTPQDHPGLSSRHAALGATYHSRFQHLGKPEDITRAIEHQLRALARTSHDDPELPSRHDALGVSYINRFQRLSELGDLESSIEYCTSALKLTPEDHPDLSTRNANLGAAYTHKFQSGGQSEDLDKAIELKYRALVLTPDGHPDLPGRHFDLGLSYFSQYQRTNDPSHLRDALDSFRSACTRVSGALRDQFRYALHWADLASRYSALNCIEAYETTMKLLPQFVWLGATTSQRYQDLSITENLAIKAASAAVSSSEHNLALEWLEHARCVVWNQSVTLRSPLDELKFSHKDLANRIQAVAKLLYDAGSDSPEAQTPSTTPVTEPLANVGRYRRLLARTYTELTAEARQSPGFGDFLRPIKSCQLICAARNGPIVTLNCDKTRLDALIALPGQGQIVHLPLPGFNEEKAKKARSDLETSLRRKGLRQRGVKVRLPPGYKDAMIHVLLDLWNEVVKPVLDFLGYINDVSSDSTPHITWCPTGALSFLPLHAAGDYDQPRSRAFDYVISSYTPTLTAILTSTQSTPTRPSRVLAIGQTKTPGHAPLPGTAKELGWVKAHTHTHAQATYTQLTEDEATTVAVLDAMEQHDWVHLACHAHQNVDDPTKSGFYLYDGTLDLASINRRSFKNKGLAFLSACQTATGDEKLPDEAIHLASGMLMAGYPSVIATMWSVVDEDAPFVADKVYAELMKDGKIGNGEAGKALHYAVDALREKVGGKEFGRWVPYVHIGS